MKKQRQAMSIRLDPILHHQVKITAALHRVSMNSLIDQAIREWFDRNPLKYPLVDLKEKEVK